MKPFLLLATRPEDEAADGEYAGFLAAGGLEPKQLHRVRLEAEPMPPIDLDDYSGVIVGGSPFNASDAEEAKGDTQLRAERELFALLDEVIARDFPFLGACYGIGLLGTYLRGVVDRTYSEPVGRTRVTLTREGIADPLFGVLDSSFDAFVGHKEASRSLPAGAVLLATGDECPVQAFRVGQNVYATQFHPELTVEGIITRIRVYRDHGYFPADTMNDLIEEVSGAQVTVPARLTRAFAERYAR